MIWPLDFELAIKRCARTEGKDESFLPTNQTKPYVWMTNLPTLNNIASLHPQRLRLPYVDNDRVHPQN